jgi:hypothetical protein
VKEGFLIEFAVCEFDDERVLLLCLPDFGAFF